MIIKADMVPMNTKLLRLSKITDLVNSELDSWQESFNGMQIFWDGGAEEEYLIRFNGDMYQAKIFLEKIRGTVTKLSEILTKYQNNESRIEEIVDSFM